MSRKAADTGKPRDYPEWICTPCGRKAGKPMPQRMSTYHVGTCGWCGELDYVTEPRDWGYPAMVTK